MDAGAIGCGANVAASATIIDAAGADAETVATSRSDEGCALVILQWLQHGIVPCMNAIIDLVWQHGAAPAGATAANTNSAATRSVAERRVTIEIWLATIERTSGPISLFRKPAGVHESATRSEEEGQQTSPYAGDWNRGGRSKSLVRNTAC